jgi:hypothetical protein
MSETQTATQPETDPFTAAFEQLSNFAETATMREIDNATETVDEDEPEAPAEAPAPEAQEAAPAPAPAEEAEEVETDEGEEPAPAENAADEDDEILRKLSALVRKGAEKEAPASRQEAPQAQPQAEAPPLYTEEETKFLQEYEKDWPDVAKAEALRRRQEYHQLVGFVFGEVAKELKPLLETVNVLATRTHLSELQSTVTDYDTVRDKVIDWVGTQPKYLQAAYQRVIQEGTVDEVADLVERYKRETGAVAKPAAPASRKRDTELPPAAKQAAAALAPVGSKRSAVVTGIDPSDFGSAFEAFADKV